ncbi:MAG: VCBS repeat-containing protein [Fuerstiella sp.]|nr:VCBS repeat-containing protein [Fuerstiella sp.]MCP4787605.1 VCBS repeat-containing protein [Fuerstiella sp.]MCP4859104.1 VCBS repeat-containing protein [Fuerstiella sp.]
MLRKFYWTFWLFLASTTGCGTAPSDRTPPESVSVAATDIKTQVVKFCGDCHAYPAPDTLPKGLWEAEVKRGFGFYADSGRADLHVPVVSEVVRYYDSHAPAEQRLQIPGEVSRSSSVRFEKQIIQAPDTNSSAAIADILHSDNSLFLSDMKNGQILKVDLQDPDDMPTVVATAENPCQLDSLKVGADGKNRLLVSDLGSFLPGDHADGRVLLVDPAGGSTVVLAEKLGRVADARFADLTGDGRLDIVVAEFGWRKTGRLLLLERITPSNAAISADSFRMRVLDDRHGASHVPIVDLDGDGDLDLIVLFSQEHERIVAFINDGHGEFRKDDVYAADRPDYGSSCISVDDMDSDGDVDILYVNGDSMDSHMLKSCHSVQWLENDGNSKFSHHHIDQLPGAYGVSTGDMDNDGDRDIVAVTMTWWYDVPFNSVVWFEQLDEKKFVRHNLDLSPAQHATLEVGDFDGDGDSDIAVGEFETRSVATPGICTIWWNTHQAAAK